MNRIFSTLTLVACFALFAQASIANAQSGSNAASKQGSAAKQGSVAKQGSASKAGSATKSNVSRAFANGNNVPSTGLALEGYCPVCYIEANKAAKGDSKFSYDYKGVTYWFVSAAVRDTFKANPDKYVPAYGGWCATGVALGQRFPVDPTNFKVVDGRILLFLKNEKIDGVGHWNLSLIHI